MPILFALVGATGIGKTNLSLELAQHYNAEIIGVDSRQIYRGFRIGTAQPDPASLGRVKHQLVDFLDPRESFSAGAFCDQVKKLLEENPRKNFILVGGTGLYLQSLFLGLPKIPVVEPSIRRELENLAAQEGAANLFKMASAVDPESSEKVDPANVQRLVRILEVYKATGRKLSEFQKERQGGLGLRPVFWLQRDRNELYRRIDRRVDQMIEDGWLEEVRELSKRVPLEAPAWQSLGYRELLLADDSQERPEERDRRVKLVVEEVKKKTRNYAKRQITWFKWQIEHVPVDMDGSSSRKIQEIFEKIKVP